MSVRSLLTVALAALLSAPSAVRAAEQKAATKPGPAPAKTATAASPVAAGPAIGGWIGYEAGDLDGLQLRFDYVMPYQKLSPQVGLSFVGSVGYSHLTDSVSVPGNTSDLAANILKFVPAARFTLPLSPELSLFGDAGLGLYLAFTSVDNSNAFLPDTSSTDVGFMLRLGAGATYALNPRTRIAASLVLDPMFGGYDDVTLSILAGLTYQL